MHRCRPACPYARPLSRVGDQRVDRVGQSAPRSRRVVGVVVHQRARYRRRRPPRECRRHRRPPPRSRRPSPRGSRCPTAHTPTGTRKPLLPRGFRESCRSGASPGPRTRRCGRAASSCTADAHLVGDLRGVRRAGAQHQLNLGANWCAAATRCATPFCRVIRPTNATIGPVGSTPSSASTDPSDAGRGRVPDVGVDAVADDVHPVGIQRRIGAQHVVAHAGADRDHRVGGLDRGAAPPRTRPGSHRRAARPSTVASAPANARSARAECRRAAPPDARPSRCTRCANARRWPPRRRWPSPGRPTASTAPRWRP